MKESTKQEPDGPRKGTTAINAVGKPRNKILWIVIGLLLVIIAFAFVMTKLIQSNSECTANPLVYGAKLASDKGTAIRCTCDVLKENYNDFWFNNETIEVSKTETKGGLLYNVSMNFSII